MKNKTLKLVFVATLGVSALTGCMGQMATTGMVSKFNLEVVDNRYGREGIFLLLSPVYGIAGAADLFIVNAIEFWTGTNPISGQSPAVVDTPTKNYIKVNDKLDSSLKEVPLASNSEYNQAVLTQIDSDTVEMALTDQHGKLTRLKGVEKDGCVHFYVNGEFITQVSNQDLETYVKASRV